MKEGPLSSDLKDENAAERNPKKKDREIGT